MSEQPVRSQVAPRRTPVKRIAVGFLLLGGVLGFGAGVLAVKEGRSFVAGAFQTEQKATVGQPTTVDRPAFRFQYAGNWKVDVGDKDYDPDHSFSLDSPGQSFVMFQVADGALDPKEVVETHATLQTSKLVKQATRAPFTRWGAYTGEGILLKGKLLGLTPGSVRIFSFRDREHTYTVVESTYDEDRANVGPGFELIERTFLVKDP
ncbi:MAG TPA: hypothetical protein VLT33_33620 [Labilithrix sp.]|nr:hypothetical protein [Labilithrix sp.]